MHSVQWAGSWESGFETLIFRGATLVKVLGLWAVVPLVSKDSEVV